MNTATIVHPRSVGEHVTYNSISRTVDPVVNPRTLNYVIQQLHWLAKGVAYGVHGDFIRDGITYVDVDFPTVRDAIGWLKIVEDDEVDNPAIIGDFRDPVASIHQRVTLTLTVPAYNS